MSITATYIETETFNTIHEWKAFRFTIPSIIAGGTSDEIVFTCSDFPKEGEIHTIRVVCASTDFDFSLRGEAGVTTPDISEFYLSQNNDGKIIDLNNSIIWSNNEPTEVNEMYGKITNTDGVNATGLIQFEFIMRRF